jgi:hypothetical protein
MMMSSSHFTARIRLALSIRSESCPLVADSRRNGRMNTAAIRLMAVEVESDV